MNRFKLHRKALIRDALGSAVVFAVLLVFLRSRNSQYLLQDTLFLTGFMYIMLTLFRIGKWTGFFDLFSYGYNQVIATIRRSKSGDLQEQQPFYEYVQSRERVIGWEAAVLGTAYWAAALALRLLT